MSNVDFWEGLLLTLGDYFNVRRIFFCSSVMR